MTTVRTWYPGDYLVLPRADDGPAPGRWTRLCWYLSRKLGGRPVFGKWDLT